MCRTGEKHCPLNHAQREDHNHRRRKNRRIRKQINEFIAGRDDVPEGFAKLPIDKQKDWVQRHGGGLSILQADTAEPLPRGNAAQAPEPREPVAQPQRPIERTQETPPEREATVQRERRRPRRVEPAVPAAPKAGAGTYRPGVVERPNRLPLDARLLQAVGPSTDISDAHKLQILNIHAQIDATDEIEVGLYRNRIQQELTPGHRGVNSIQRVAFEGGGEGYFKPFAGTDTDTASSYGDNTNQQPIHEVAAWQLARNLGPEYASIVAPCAIRQHSGQWGSISLGAHGTVFGASNEARQQDLRTRPETRKQLNDAAFFDALIGNQDRHGGNFLANHRGITLIDHGFAFSPHEQVRSGVLLERAKGDDHRLTREERAHLDDFLSSKDAHGMAGILEPKRIDAMRARAKLMRDTGTVRAAQVLGFLF